MLLWNFLLVPLGALLWLLGGPNKDLDSNDWDEQVNDFGHTKVVHIFDKVWQQSVWSFIVGLVLLLNHTPLLTVIIVTCSITITLGLTYDNASGIDISNHTALVGFLLGVPVVFIFPTWFWPVVMLCTFRLLHWISLEETWVRWKVARALVGALQGTMIATALLK